MKFLPIDFPKLPKGLLLVGAIVALGPAQATANPLKIETPAGTFDFENSYPADAETSQRLYDEMDFQRATQAVLWSLPVVSNFAFLADFLAQPDIDYYDLAIFENYADTKTLLLTANNTTIYGLSVIDLARSGPLVLDIPAGDMAGMVDDGWWRALTMIGSSGPDKGKGGKFLLLPPGYKGEVPSTGYFVINATTNDLNFMVRGFVKNNDVKTAVDTLKQITIYPYSDREKPSTTKYINVTGRDLNTLAPGGIEYWELLSKYINNNPVDERDRFFLAMLKPLGIEKGKPFQPTERQKKILSEGLALGMAMAANNTFDPRLSGAAFYPGTNWNQTVLMNPDQETKFYSQLDERLYWFFIATYMNDSMALKKAGPGSVYLQSFKDSDDSWLDASQNYRLNIPANPPTDQFWSITVYDSQTKSMLPNAENLAARTSYDDLKKNADGSINLYFGPDTPEGLKSNWIDTRPSKGFFVWFRSYTPTEAFFDKSWSLPDIEKLD